MGNRGCQLPAKAANLAYPLNKYELHASGSWVCTIRKYVFFNLAYNNLSLTFNFYHVIKGVNIVAVLQIRDKKNDERTQWKE